MNYGMSEIYSDYGKESTKSSTEKEDDDKITASEVITRMFLNLSLFALAIAGIVALVVLLFKVILPFFGAW